MKKFEPTKFMFCLAIAVYAPAHSGGVTVGNGNEDLERIFNACHDRIYAEISALPRSDQPSQDQIEWLIEECVLNEIEKLN